MFAVVVGMAAAVFAMPQVAAAERPDTIARVKASVVAVGTLQKLRSPQFQFLGTGFAVGDGSLVATNAHVVSRPLATGADPELLVVAIPSDNPQQPQIRVVQRAGEDAARDLALLRLPGAPLPALKLRDSDTVREGEQFLLTGEELDILPFADRDLLYAAHRQSRRTKIKPFITGRGCPYNCAFCFNKAYSDLYGGQAHRFRRRSVDNVIRELKEVASACDVRWGPEPSAALPGVGAAFGGAGRVGQALFA